MTSAADLMSEAQLQAAVFDALDAYGWMSYHTHDSRRSRRGFPDVCAIHPGTGRILFAELKSAKGRLTREQATWIDALDSVPGVEVHVWRPAHLLDGTITAALARRTITPNLKECPRV